MLAHEDVGKGAGAEELEGMECVERQRRRRAARRRRVGGPSGLWLQRRLRQLLRVGRPCHALLSHGRRCAAEDRLRRRLAIAVREGGNVRGASGDRRAIARARAKLDLARSLRRSEAARGRVLADEHRFGHAADDADGADPRPQVPAEFVDVLGVLVRDLIVVWDEGGELVVADRIDVDRPNVRRELLACEAERSPRRAADAGEARRPWRRVGRKDDDHGRFEHLGKDARWLLDLQNEVQDGWRQHSNRRVHHAKRLDDPMVLRLRGELIAEQAAELDAAHTQPEVLCRRCRPGAMAESAAGAATGTLCCSRLHGAIAANLGGTLASLAEASPPPPSLPTCVRASSSSSARLSLLFLCLEPRLDADRLVR